MTNSNAARLNVHYKLYRTGEETSDSIILRGATIKDARESARQWFADRRLDGWDGGGWDDEGNSY